MKARAPFRYWGSKVRMAPWVVDRLPIHDHFIEACAGSAAIMAVKPPVAAETLNDLYSEVVGFFRVLQDPEAFGRLVDRVAFTPYALEEFQLAGDLLARVLEPADHVEAAWAFFVRMQMAVVPGRSGWSFGVNGASAYKANKPGRWSTMPALLAACADRFAKVQVEQRDILDLIDRYDAPGVLFLVDPPYEEESRPLTGAGDASPYVHDSFDHGAFLAAIHGAKHASFAITHYVHDRYEGAGLEVIGDYESHRNVPNGDGRDVRVERLYLLNRGPALEVPQPSLFGAAS